MAPLPGAFRWSPRRSPEIRRCELLECLIAFQAAKVGNVSCIECAEGFAIGKARIQAYTEKMYNVMTKTWGLAPWMLRAPYGIFEYFIKSKLNLPFIEWDVDTKDWTGKSSAAVMTVVRDETKDGSIILMHDIKDHTPESGKRAAEWLYDNGFMCVTVEELFIQYQQDMTPNKVFYSVRTTGE